MTTAELYEAVRFRGGLTARMQIEELTSRYECGDVLLPVVTVTTDEDTLRPTSAPPTEPCEPLEIDEAFGEVP